MVAECREKLFTNNKLHTDRGYRNRKRSHVKDYLEKRPYCTKITVNIKCRNR